MKKAAVEDYAFLVGKIRALERLLFTAEVFRQAEEADLNAALQLFAESELYTDELLHGKDSAKLEDLLNQELRQLQGMINRLMLDKPLLGLMDLSDLPKAQKITSDYGSQFLKDYINFVIDMYNIKTFLRLYVLKEPPEKLQAHINCSGFIPQEDFIHFYNQDIALFLSRLEYVHAGPKIFDYSLFLKSGIDKAVKDRLFITLERQINDFLITVLKPARYFIFGPEPVLVHYWARVNEINLIRMIVLAKIDGVSSDLVKERLNITYA